MSKKERNNIKNDSSSKVLNKGKKISLFNSNSLGANFFASLIFFLVTLCIAVGSLVMTIRFEDEKTISYGEKGHIDYQICYKNDDFYEGKCFTNNSNMRFIANLIDNIKLHYSYDFDIEENSNINYNYDIIAKITINDSVSGKVYYEKEYPLVDNKAFVLKDDKHISISEDVDIIYGDYNNLAKQFNDMYGVNSVSKLIVYMTIHKESEESSSLVLNNTSLSYISMPLSEKAIDMEVNTKDFENRSTVISKATIKIKNVIFAVLFLIFTFLTVYYVIKVVHYLMKMFPPLSKYDKYVNRLLKEYDRLIGEAKNLISFEDKEVVRFDKFSELLDIHDNLNVPIMFYNVALHKEAYFYIVSDKIVYLYDAKEENINKGE